MHIESSSQENHHHKGWYSRGYLPHRDQGGIFQSITYRLADSLPQEYLKELRIELRIKSNKRQERERRIKIENLLDRNYGSCILKYNQCAKIVEENWKHFDGIRYNLISYVVMPNHVHVLIEQNKSYELGEIVKSWKGYSSRQINKCLHNAGLATSAPGAPRKRLWQRGYWDRYIRNGKHFIQTIEYIKNNYEKGGILHYSAIEEKK
jgi:REP-associated tyrosine transposase